MFIHASFPGKGWGLRALAALGVMLLLAGCAWWARPTPVPAPALPTPGPQATPSPSATASPTLGIPGATPTSVVAPGVFRPGLPTPVPIIYKMFDWGTDYQRLNPELGPIGSIQFALWEAVNPGPGQFNWKAIDDKLALEAGLKVTLPDGREIPKPVVIQVFAYISSAPNWNATFYDATPGWVYDRIGGRPVVQGKKVGYVLTGCNGMQAVMPMYDSPVWREAYYDMVRAFGARYADHPQVAAVVINTGLDGETQPIKDQGCQWNTIMDQQAGGVRYNFNQFVNETMAVYRQAFPRTPIFINNAPGGSGMRKATSDYAATFDPPIGLKHSGMWVDLDSHQGYGTFVGSWDMIRAYSMTLPIWLESPFGLGNAEHRYWSLIAGLHYHPDAIDVHPEYLTQSDPAWLRFVVAHLGVDLNNTPDVWTVLRDAEYPLQSWGTGGVSGHMGDWCFWLYRQDAAPQSETERVWRQDMPAARDHVYSRQTRRTQQAKNQIYMSFNIDDGYPYVNQKPIDVPGGNVYYQVHVTLLNMGTDTFALQYRNWAGDIVSQVKRKGPQLGPVDDWVTVTFLVRDGYFNNNMPGEGDFRISCERDGDEYIHMVRVEGRWGVPPTATPTALVTPTPRPTATATPAPSPTATPRPPTPTSSPLAPTPTRTLATTPTMPPSATPVVTSTPVATWTPSPGTARVILREGDNYRGVADTFLDAWNANKNFQDAIRMSARQGAIRAPLLRFDLSPIPANVSIKRATLYLYLVGRSNAGSLQLSVAKLRRPWDLAAVTWNQATASEAWGQPGARDVGTDRADTVYASRLVEEERGWSSWDITTLVQEWVSEPAGNYGLLLVGEGGVSVQYDFTTSRWTVPEFRPYLEIEYVSASPSPTLPPKDTPTPTPSPAPTATPTPTPLPPSGSFTFQQGLEGYQGAVDTYIDRWNAQTNNAANRKLIVRQGDVRSALLAFDLQSIPAHSYVTEAWLYLYIVARSGPSPLPVRVVALSRPWDVQEVSFQRASKEAAWNVEGVNKTSVDLAPQASALGILDGEGRWVAFELTALVQEWLDRPERNYGLIIKADGTTSVQYEFASAEWDRDPTLRPKLVVSWKPPITPVTPTPTIMAPTATPSPTATRTLTPSPTRPKGNLVLQQGLGEYQGAADTQLDAWQQEANLGQNATFGVRQNDIRLGLVRFELSGVPAKAIITSASLDLWISYASNPGKLTLQAYLVRRPWNENTATWLEADTAIPWGGPGASDPLRDRYATPVGEVLLSGGEQRWVTVDVTSAVRHWLEHPEENYGLLLRGEGTTSVEYQFASSQWRQGQQRPKLSLSYELETGAAGVTPGRGWRWLVGALVLAALLVLLLGRRRRRPEDEKTTVS